jgi:hypothetical protein
MTATSGAMLGMFKAFVGFRDSNGYPMGVYTDPDNAPHNAVYTPLLLPGPINVASPAISRLVAFATGGQRLLNKRVLGVQDIGDFQFTLAHYSETFNALISQTTVDETTLTSVATTAPNTGLAEPPQMFIGFILGFDTIDGDHQFLTMIYHNVQIANYIPSGSTAGGENPNPLTYTVTPSPSARTMSGLLYEDTALAVTDDRDILSCYRFQYGLLPVTYVDDNSAGSFTLPYLPVDDDETGAAVNSITKQGAITAVTSVATATGLVTLVAAGTDFDRWVVLYPTAFATA